ncbi:class V chitinase-like [Cornus florida]|uniref:class V chitinase-like n=1 Tax=Cornus florida TaxID=4283 RepID=UPI00289C0828|nr:class V chitinase-like [Cornus florida]
MEFFAAASSFLDLLYFLNSIRVKSLVSQVLCSFHTQLLEHTRIKAGYWYSGSEFPTTDIISSLFTHLICAYAGLNSSTYQISISASDDYYFSTFTDTIKQKNPSVVTLLSIGGGLANSSLYSSMISQSSSRQSFIQSSIITARFYGFHGLDFCWVSLSTESDMANMAILLDEW